MGAAVYDPSVEALRILTDTFWCAQGWRQSPAWPEAEGMALAVGAGVMFAEPFRRDHDEWVGTARAAVRRLSAGEVGGEFLASLSSRRLDLRSALGSYALALNLPEHSFEPVQFSAHCAVCGVSEYDAEPKDVNVLSFERFRWGGVRHSSVCYAAFDLEQFARAPRLAPTPDDLAMGQQLIDELRALPPQTTAAQAVSKVKVLRGNKSERSCMLDLLGVCGILQTAEHHGYGRSFVRARDRATPDLARVFGHYPICWWHASDGVDAEALRQFLPQLH